MEHNCASLNDVIEITGLTLVYPAPNLSAAQASASSCRKKLAELFLHHLPLPLKSIPACVDQSLRGLPKRQGRRVEMERDRGRWGAVAQEPRPGGEVGTVEKRVVSAKAELLGEDWRIGRSSATSLPSDSEAVVQIQGSWSRY